MLIAVSGSQGSGKTTVVNELSRRDYHTVEHKVARQVLTEWNMTLDDVYSNAATTAKFQEQLLERKLLSERENVSSSQVWITERTYADLFTYAVLCLGGDSAYSEWLNTYYIQCMQAQQTYDTIFYLRAGAFAVQDDGVRRANPHYSRLVDIVMYDITKSMSRPGTLIEIDTPILSHRVDRIECLCGISY